LRTKSLAVVFRTVNLADKNLLLVVCCEIFPCWGKMLAVSTPRRVELNKPWLRTNELVVRRVDDLLVETSLVKRNDSLSGCYFERLGESCDQDESDREYLHFYLLRPQV